MFRRFWNWLKAGRRRWIIALAAVLILGGLYGRVFHRPAAVVSPTSTPVAPAPPPAKPTKSPARPRPAAAAPSPHEIDQLVLSLGNPYKTRVARAQDKLEVLGEAAVLKLVANLYHDDKDVRVATGWTLIRISGPAVQPLLEELAECEDEKIAHLIACILKRIGPAIGPLKKLAGTARLQDAAREILDQIREDRLNSKENANSKEEDTEARTNARVSELTAALEKMQAEFRVLHNAWARASIEGREDQKVLHGQVDKMRREIAQLKAAIAQLKEEASAPPTSNSYCPTTRPRWSRR